MTFPCLKPFQPASERLNPFSSGDVTAILREKSWLNGEPSELQLAWCARAATFLGPQAIDLAGLKDLIGLVFQYDAQTILRTTEAHVVMSRYAARDVLRQLALYLLDGTALNSDRFSEMIAQLKERTGLRSREIFHPLRLALAGRSGEGELDRVILLLDEAAKAEFPGLVKTARERILEFCSALD